MIDYCEQLVVVLNNILVLINIIADKILSNTYQVSGIFVCEYSILKSSLTNSAFSLHRSIADYLNLIQPKFVNFSKNNIIVIVCCY